MEDKKLTRIIELHAKLARRVKEYEQTVDIFPPTEVLNEMRYALYYSHMILSLKKVG